MDNKDPIQDMNELYEHVLNLYSKVGPNGIKSYYLWIKNEAIKLKAAFDKKHLKSDYFNWNYDAIISIFD